METSKKKSGLNLKKRSTLAGFLFTMPVIIGFLVFTVGPLAVSLYLSFTEYTMVGQPNWIGWDNYLSLFKNEDQVFWKSLKVTAYYVLVGTPIYLLASFGVALLLNRSFRGRGVVRTILYLPAVIHTIAVTMVWKWLTDPSLGVLNNLSKMLGLGIKLTWFYSESTSIPTFILLWIWTCGTTFIVFLAGLQNVPSQLYEAMEVDGGNAWHKLVYITVPMLTPTILFCSMVGFVTAVQCFVPSYSITNGGPNNSTMLLFYYMYREGFRFLNMGKACAIAWVLFVILLIFTQLFGKTTKYWVYYGGE